MPLTKKDLKEIKDIVRDSIIENNIILEQELGTKFDMRLEEKLDQKLDEKLKYLPSKEEFYTQMDKIMSELKIIRDELIVTTHRSINNTDRIEKLEERVFEN